MKRGERHGEVKSEGGEIGMGEKGMGQQKAIEGKNSHGPVKVREGGRLLGALNDGQYDSRTQLQGKWFIIHFTKTLQTKYWYSFFSLFFISVQCCMRYEQPHGDKHNDIFSSKVKIVSNGFN